jgi:uncharacterized protein (DUF1778 family)
MGKKQGTDDELRVTAQTRMTPAQYQLVKAVAAAKGLPLSAFIRMAAINAASADGGDGK